MAGATGAGLAAEEPALKKQMYMADPAATSGQNKHQGHHNVKSMKLERSPALSEMLMAILVSQQRTSPLLQLWQHELQRLLLAAPAGCPRLPTASCAVPPTAVPSDGRGQHNQLILACKHHHTKRSTQPTDMFLQAPLQ